MRRGTLRALAALTLLGGTACSLLLPIPDISSESDNPNLGPKGEAGLESGAEAAGTNFCLGHPNALLCADFDDATHSIDFGWDNKKDGPTATLTLDQGASVSAPRSLLAAWLENGGREAYLSKRVPPDGRLMVSFSVRPSITHPSYAEYLRIDYSGFSIRWRVTDTETTIQPKYADGGAGRSRDLLKIERGVWTRVAFDVRLGQAPTLDISYDGTLFPRIDLDLRAPEAGIVEIGLITGYPGLPQGAVNVDNVLIEVLDGG